MCVWVLLEIVSARGIAAIAAAIAVVMKPLGCGWWWCGDNFSRCEVVLGVECGQLERQSVRPPRVSYSLTLGELVPLGIIILVLFLLAFNFEISLRVSNESNLRTLSAMDTWKWTPQSKLCFVTTGATAPFTALIESVLSSSTLNALRSNGYTHLLVQYGSAKDIFDKSSTAARLHIAGSKEQGPLIVDGIDFDPNSLQSQFTLVQQSKGLVISHAGMMIFHPIAF